MKIHRWYNGFTLPINSGIVIGNFDGVHRGHQAMINRLQGYCARRELRAFAMSFYPHPRSVLTQEEPALLTTLRDRAYWLAKYGIEDWIIVPFTQRFRQTEAVDFVQRYLVQALSMRYLLVGDDFRFGYRGKGDFSLLQSLGPTHDFQLEAINTVVSASKRISSSAVREALIHHDLDRATRLLGHPLSFTGKVKYGSGRGRKLSARTANLHVPLSWCLPDGVYVVKLRICDSAQQYWGVANLGAAPTFSSVQRKLEVHILDATPDCYGKMLQVSMQHFLRGVEKFPDAQTLQKQIQQDIKNARQFMIKYNERQQYG